ncbi:ABC transporter ATP-binding protein [Nitritalea halalkaliphila]|uniref:ABC transporter ATP-binding protein n=1 Tax=Nitritalea halalkaliphila TaxID=590849 RepID=UPI002934C3D7|nr:ATP-binding cassette domain-containing protein [Nitritalea halalkaliphila]
MGLLEGEKVHLWTYPRFISAKSGKIYIDGLPLDKIQAASLRAHIGIVNQDSFLFHASVRDNIAFGKPDASQEEIEVAAKIAHAHLFISQLVDGYATPVGDRGVQLSGGQRQRICIARAILSNPSILLLDEATSALDTESERLVQNALDHLMHNRTTLVIAHRLSTIQRADLIVVLDQGRIVAQGTHESLLAEDGLYSRLIEMQQFTPY